MESLNNAWMHFYADPLFKSWPLKINVSILPTHVKFYSNKGGTTNLLMKKEEDIYLIC